MNKNETAAIALEKHGNSVLRMAYSYLKNISDAEDVLQDTLLQYMRKAPDFEGEEHEKAWLLRVAANLCKNRLKGPWKKYSEIPETYPTAPLPEDEPGVTMAVLALPIKYREVIHLFYYEQYSTKMIADTLKKNESTVRSLLHRARELLRETLKGEYGPDGEI